MGLFFYIHSVALIEDLPLEDEYKDLNEFYQAANAAYNQVGLSIYIKHYVLSYFLYVATCATKL